MISRLGSETVLTDSTGKMQQGIIANLQNSTQFEAHPVFKMESTDGNLPDDGAYLLFLSILGVDASAQAITYAPSQPFALLMHINAQRSFDASKLEMALSVVPEITLNDYPRIHADTLTYVIVHHVCRLSPRIDPSETGCAPCTHGWLAKNGIRSAEHTPDCNISLYRHNDQKPANGEAISIRSGRFTTFTG